MKRIVLQIALASLGWSLMYPLGVQSQTTPLVVSSTVTCATSIDGSVVGVQNPLNPPVVSAAYSGTLGAGNYFIQIGWYDAAGHVTLAGPEVQTQLAATGELQISLPTSGKPAAAVGMDVYVGASSGAETLQGQTAGAATYTQSAPLAAGAALPAANTTVCAVVANDAGWPTGTGYDVSMVTPAGDVMPGYPMEWQLLGPGTTINLGQGLPLYNGTVVYPIPVLARPYNHAAQSISGPLSMTNYALTQVGELGVGTATPAWPVDIENGAMNSAGGYIYNGGLGVAPGDCLVAGSDPFATFMPSSAPCLTSVNQSYQTLENSGTQLPQEKYLNVTGGLAAVDDPTNQATDIELPATIAAGTYVQPTSLTLSKQGIVVGITTGGSTLPVNTTCTSAGCYMVQADGTIREWGSVSDAAYGCGGNVNCAVPVIFPYALPASVHIVPLCTLSGLSNAGQNTNFACGIDGAPSTTGMNLDPAALVYVGGAGSTLAGSETANWEIVAH